MRMMISFDDEDNSEDDYNSEDAGNSEDDDKF